MATPAEYPNVSVSEEEAHAYLMELRDSGETNMFGAGAYLETEFDLNSREAKEVLMHWMQSF